MTTASINDNVAEIQKVNQYLGAFIASLGGFALGISLGWNSKAGIVLKENLDATATEIGLIGGILNAGICVGAILMPFIAGPVSRTKIMFSTLFILVPTWVLLIIHRRQNAVVFIIGRLLYGICGGVFCVLTPIYIAEIASTEIRGRLLAFFQLLINCGIMFAFYITHAIDDQALWWYSRIFAFACISIAATKLLPETPLYYLSRNDEINAEISLRWYRGYPYDVQHEISEMKRLILATRSKKFSLQLLKNRRVLRSIATCFGVILAQHLCGVNMMIFYALTLFDTSGSGELTGSEQTLVVGAVQILVSLLAMFLVDVFGRRILLTFSSLLMGLFLILLDTSMLLAFVQLKIRSLLQYFRTLLHIMHQKVKIDDILIVGPIVHWKFKIGNIFQLLGSDDTGYFFSLRDADPENDDVYFWMSPTWLTLFFASYNLGLGPISWSILGDTLPEELKTPVVSISVAFGWLISLMATLTFDEVFISLGGTKVMWLSAAVCWLIALFCAIVVKDNTGKSLIEIQKDFRIESNEGLEET